MSIQSATKVLVALPNCQLVGLFQSFWIRKEVTLQLQNGQDDGIYIWTDLRRPKAVQVKYHVQKCTFCSRERNRIWYKIAPSAVFIKDGLIGDCSEAWHQKRFKDWGFVPTAKFTQNMSEHTA